jgi:hypothetical protein
VCIFAGFPSTAMPSPVYARPTRLHVSARSRLGTFRAVAWPQQAIGSSRTSRLSQTVMAEPIYSYVVCPHGHSGGWFWDARPGARQCHMDCAAPIVGCRARDEFLGCDSMRAGTGIGVCLEARHQVAPDQGRSILGGSGMLTRAVTVGVHASEFGAHQDELSGVVDPDQHHDDRGRGSVGRGPACRCRGRSEIFPPRTAPQSGRRRARHRAIPPTI